jgi:hypothetical protein
METHPFQNIIVLFHYFMVFMECKLTFMKCFEQEMRKLEAECRPSFTDLDFGILQQRHISLGFKSTIWEEEMIQGIRKCYKLWNNK